MPEVPEKEKKTSPNPPDQGVTPDFIPVEDIPEHQRAFAGEMGEKGQVGIESDPWVDPTTVAAGAFGATGKLSLQAGLKFMPSLGRAVTAGIVGGAAEYPIGMATEKVGEKYPGAALPFNVLVGMLSGATVERALEKGAIKALSKRGVDAKNAPEAVKRTVESLKSKLDAGVSDEETTPVLSELRRLLRDERGSIELPDKPGKKQAQKILEEKPEMQQKADELAESDLLPEKGWQEAGRSGAELFELPKYAGNINIRRLTDQDELQRFIFESTDALDPELQKMRRGVRSWAKTEEAARRYTLEDLLGRKVGQAFNAEQVENGRSLLLASSEALHDMTRKIQAGQATDVEKANFYRAFQMHYAILEQVSGAAAEAGRALNIFRKMPENPKLQLQQMKDLMEHMPTSVDELAEAITHMGGDPIKISRFTKDAARATTRGMFLEAWINGLLSGPHTHMVNSISNSLVAAWQVPERFLAAALGRVTPGPRAIKEQEALQQAYGLIEGAKDGLKAFAQVMRTGDPSDMMSKLETARYHAISAENLKEVPLGKLIRKISPRALDEGTISGRFADLLGEAVRLPGRALMAEDEFFKGIGYRMDLRARAYRTIMEEDLTGDDAAKRMAQILEDPERYAPELHLSAVDAARYQTFTQPLESKILRSLSRSDHPLLRLIVPFVRTPTNIMKFGFERTPLAPIMKSVRADIAAGGARRDLALARMSMGSMAMGVMAKMAADGYITGGGPSDPSLQAAWRRQGYQPYSVKIGDKWVSYSRIEPMGMLFGLAADFAEITGLAGEELQPEMEKLAVAIIASIAKNITSKTFLRGLSEGIQAMEDPDRYGNRYVQNYARTLIPTGIAQIERTMSPEFEVVYSIADAIKSRVPGLSDSLPPRRDFWGRPITAAFSPTGERSWAEISYSALSPFYVSTSEESPIDKEVLRLKMGLQKPRRNVSINGEAIPLTPEEYDDYIVLMNKVPMGMGNLKKTLNHLVQSPGYKQMPRDRKEQEIRKFVVDAKEKALLRLQEKYPHLREMAMRLKEKRMINPEF